MFEKNEIVCYVFVSTKIRFSAACWTDTLLLHMRLSVFLDWILTMIWFVIRRPLLKGKTVSYGITLAVSLVFYFDCKQYF